MFTRTPAIWRSGDSGCKGPEVRKSVMCLKNRAELEGNREGWAGGQWVGKDMWIKVEGWVKARSFKVSRTMVKWACFYRKFHWRFLCGRSNIFKRLFCYCLDNESWTARVEVNEGVGGPYGSSCWRWGGLDCRAAAEKGVRNQDSFWRQGQ